MTKSSTAQMITEEQAYQIMWQHFHKNKTTLVEDIRLSRDLIVRELLAGKTADDVFSRFIRPPEPPPPTQPRQSLPAPRRQPTPAVFRQGKA